MSQLVNTLNRPPRPMSPGRSALSAQLQQLAANRLAHNAAQQPETQVVFGHDPIEMGRFLCDDSTLCAVLKRISMESLFFYSNFVTNMKWIFITVPEDLCLLGCVFFITDYQRYLSSEQITTWKKVIAQHGGQVDDSYSNRVTHLLCETQQSDVFVMVSDHTAPLFCFLSLYADFAKIFVPLVWHFVWQSLGTLTYFSGFRRSFSVLMDILSGDAGAPCQTFLKFVRHVWKDGQILQNLLGFKENKM